MEPEMMDLQCIKHEGIKSIQRVIKNRKVKYEIILKPNYSFEQSGSQIQYVDEYDIASTIDSIIYCDGNDIRRTIYETKTGSS